VEGIAALHGVVAVEGDSADGVAPAGELDGVFLYNLAGITDRYGGNPLHTL